MFDNAIRKEIGMRCSTYFNLIDGPYETYSACHWMRVLLPFPWPFLVLQIFPGSRLQIRVNVHLVVPLGTPIYVTLTIFQPELLRGSIALLRHLTRQPRYLVRLLVTTPLALNRIDQLRRPLKGPHTGKWLWDCIQTTGWFNSEGDKCEDTWFAEGDKLRL